MELSKIQDLLKMEFNVRETLSVLSHNKPIFFSWGVSRLTNVMDKGLMFKVNGHHHKGYVLITLDWTDTYDVHLISTHGNIVKSFDMVYFDDLVEIIDNNIERIKDYQF
jgi:hypothetical protein